MDKIIINDKFNIIGDYTSNFKKNDLDHWINSLFKNDQTHYSNDLIHQYLYKNLFLEKNDVNDIVDIVSKSLEKEITIRVKNILPRIRKNNFTMKDFENTLESILSSVGKLNSTICIIDKFRNKYFDCSEFKKYYWGMSITYKIGLNNIFSKLIDHSIIKIYLDSILLSIEDENRGSVINLFKFMYKIKNYENECFDYFIMNFINNIDNNMTTNTCSTSNIVNMGVFSWFNEFNKKIAIFKKITDYYSFLDDTIKKDLTDKLNKNLSQVLIKVFDKNISKHEIRIVMEFIYKNLEDIKIVWNILKNSENSYDKELFVNSIMNFINSKFEILVPDCNTIDGFNVFINFFDKALSLDNILNQDENNISHLNAKLSANLKNVISSDDKFIDIMCQIINKKMKEISCLENDLMNSTSISNILQLLNYINNKDIFFAKYYQHFISRLLSNPNLFYEKQMINIIESIQDYSYVKKLHKMIEDINNSNINLENYKMIKINQKNNSVDKQFNLNNLNVITFSYNVWDICLNKNKMDFKDFLDDTFKLSPQLKSYLLTFSKFYNTKYKGRNLSWYLEMGNIDVSYFVENKKYILKVNPYQMTMLELFNTSDSISQEYIMTYMTNCFGNTIEIFKNVINSFIISGLMKQSSKKEYDINNCLIENNHQMISINNNFRSDQNVINIINIYNNVSSYDLKIEKQIEKQITLDRETVVQANIINLLKIKSMSLDLLHQNLTKTLSNYFSVEKDFVKQNIDILSKKEYICSNDEEFANIIY